MKICVQKGGSALTDEEIKTVSALLVKLGYAVKLRREKESGVGVLKKTIYAEETHEDLK